MLYCWLLKILSVDSILYGWKKIIIRLWILDTDGWLRKSRSLFVHFVTDVSLSHQYLQNLCFSFKDISRECTLLERFIAPKLKFYSSMILNLCYITVICTTSKFLLHDIFSFYSLWFAMHFWIYLKAICFLLQALEKLFFLFCYNFSIFI